MEIGIVVGEAAVGASATGRLGASCVGTCVMGNGVTGDGVGFCGCGEGTNDGAAGAKETTKVVVSSATKVPPSSLSTSSPRYKLYDPGASSPSGSMIVKL